MPRYGGGTAIPLARLSFGYGPFVIAAAERRTTMARGGRLYRLVRQRDAEEAPGATPGVDRASTASAASRPSWYANPWADDLMLPGDQRRLRLAARAAARPAGAARRGLDDRDRRRLPDPPRRAGRRPVRRAGGRLRHRLAGAASRRDGGRPAGGPGALAGGDDRRVGGVRLRAAGQAERGRRRRAVPGAAAGRPFPAAAAAAHPPHPAGADGTVRARRDRSGGGG